MAAGQVLNDFNDELQIASDNIGEVQGAVTSAREGAEDVRWAVGVFGRIEDKADDLAKIIGGFGDVLNLLGKVGPLGRVFRPLENVIKDIEDVVKDIADEAGKLDVKPIVLRIKEGVDDAIERLEELESDVGEKRDEFDERREPVQETIDTLDTVGEYFDVSDVAGAVDTLLEIPLDAATAVNNLFGSESDPDSVAGKLQIFNDAVSNNPLRTAEQMERDLCAILDQLAFLQEPFAILEAALRPVRWALDASDFIFDTVVAPILNPILDAIGVNKLFDGIRSELSKLLPDLSDITNFDTSNILPDLEAELLPSIDLGVHLDLTGGNGLLDRAAEAINPTIFSADQFIAGTDGNDTLTDSGIGERLIFSGGAGNDLITGTAAFGDIIYGGSGDDTIDGGLNESSGDVVYFSGEITEYLIEFTDDATETTGDIIISHVAPVAGLVGDGIDLVRNVETFVFDGFEISATELRENLQIIAAGSTMRVDGRPGTDENGDPYRDFLIATAAGSEGTGIVLDGGDGNDHLIGSAFKDDLYGDDGDDVLDGGPNGANVADVLYGGQGLDEATFTSSIRLSGERLDLGAAERDGSILNSTATVISIERVEGSDFDDIIFGRDTQDTDGDPANGTYVERLAGGAGSDLLRGFGGDDRLEGNEGGDILIGDGGNNQLLGGIGDDVIILDSTAGAQQIDGGTGYDILYYGGFSSLTSTFDNNTEGWTAPSGSLVQTTSGSQAGQGGHLRHIDNMAGFTDYFEAPPQFLGDQSQMMGGRISFDLESEGIIPWSIGVAITGGPDGTTRIEADIAIDPALGWQTFVIALESAGSWRLATPVRGQGEAVTDQMINDVLSNVTDIEILADRRPVTETTRLDNFVLSSLPVQRPVLSQFEWNDTDGWRVLVKGINDAFSVFSTLDEAQLAATEDLIAWRSEGGNAGGWIEGFDAPGTSWFSAPEKFLGDQSGMLGGRLEFATRQVTGTNLSGEADHSVALVGGGLTLVVNMAPPTNASTWERRAVTLTADNFLIDGTNNPPSESQFLSVLSDLEGVYIRAGYKGSTDSVGLDEVRLAPAADEISATILEVTEQSLAANPVPDLNDRLVVDVAGGTVTRFDASDVQIAVDTFSGIERFVGGEQNDIFEADLGDADAVAVMDGMGGDDSFVVGTGRQIVSGGTGNDTVTVVSGDFVEGERYDGGQGIDTLDLTQVEDTRWEVILGQSLRGTDWADSHEELQGSTPAGLAGFERVLTGDYDDLVIGGAIRFLDTGDGNDTVAAGVNFEQVINLGRGDDLLASINELGGTFNLGLGNDTVAALGGAGGVIVEITGGPGDATDAEGDVQPDDDVFIVGLGRLHLIGGDGQNIVSFAGVEYLDQTLSVGLDLSSSMDNTGAAVALTYEGIQNASGGNSNDTIRGDAGSNLLIGAGGDDSLDGEGVGVGPGEGAGDVLYGNAGNDRLRGLVGDDLLHGGSGDDTLEGGVGIDTASYSFAEIGAVELDGVVQTYAADAIANVSAELGPTGGGSASSVRVLHQDDFDGGVAGFTGRGNAVTTPRNFEAELTGFGTIFGAVAQTSVPEVQKVFDLGPTHTGPVTVAFDLIEIDSWNGTQLDISTPLGFVGIAFTAGVPTATSGTTNGIEWSVETDTSVGSNLGFGAASEYLHRISLTFTPTDQFLTLGFGANFDGSGAAAEDDQLGIDNLVITGVTDRDLLSDIENLTGGGLNDSLTGNSANNNLNGAAGDDTLDGFAGDDVLLDGAGVDIALGGAGNDTIVAGRGGRDGTGDVYDGGADDDVLDYSGFETDLVITTTEVLTTYDVDSYVWADTQTSEARSFGTQTYSPRDIAQSLDPALADAADDLLRDLSTIPDPAALIETVTNSVTATDAHTGFEAVVGGAGDDLIEIGGALADADGGLGDDTIRGGSDPLILRGGGGDDRLEGGTARNTLAGNQGDDTLLGGDDVDRMFGGAGDDTLAGRGGADDLRGDDGGDLVNGNNGADTLRGGDGNDTLSGGNDNDLLSGNSGDDDMRGGSGTDRLFGGGGADTMSGDAGDDSMRGSVGDDQIFGGEGNDDIDGEDDNDTLDGGLGNDVLRGGNGADEMYGGEGADTMAGNGGDDTLSGGADNDRLFGSSGDDFLGGDDGDDLLNGGIGSDTLLGGAGADTLAGDEGMDTLAGGDGADDATGGADADLINGNNGADTLRGGTGNDTLSGGNDDDQMSGNGNNDEMRGGNGMDRMFGGGGNDLMMGGNHDDLLSGGAGQDTLEGGFGADTFVWSAADQSIHGAARDTITDFAAGVDVIDLSGFSGTLSFVGSYTGAGNEVRYNGAIGRLYIDVDGDSASDFSIDLTGAPALTAGDVIL